MTICALAQVVAAQGSYGWRVRGTAGGPTAAVALTTGHAYAAVGLRVVVYDISQPVPREVGATVPFDDFVQDVQLSGDRLYVAAGGSGIHIFDIANRASPKRVAGWDSPGSAEAVSVDGTLLYVADGPFGLQIVDLSLEQSPKRIAAAFDDLFACDVTRSGSHLLIAGAGSGLLLVDVTDPKEPREIATLNTPGFARRVAVAAGIAVVADQWGGLRVVDIANPAVPREIGAAGLQSWAMDVAVDGTTAFVATGSAGLVVLDMANPANVQQVGTVDIAARTDSVGVAVKDGRAYVAAGHGGLHAFDVANPRAPQRLGVAAPLSNGFGVAFSLPYLLASDITGLKVFDTSNPDVPREVGRLSSDVAVLFIATSGSFAYLGTDRLLRAVDLSDPAKPVERGSVGLNGPVRDIEIGDTLLLVATETDIAVVDITDRAEPRLLSTVPMVSGAYSAQAIGVTLLGRYAFVAQSQAGVAIVDLIVPSAPVVVQQYKPAGLQFAQSMRTDGRWLFIVACGSVFVVDAADPLNLRLTGTSPLPGICPYRAKFAGGRLFLAAATSGFAEVDVSTPSSPVLVGSTALPGFGFDVAIAGGLAAVAVENLGIFVLSSDAGAVATESPKVATVEREDPRLPRPPASTATPRSAVVAHAARSFRPPLVSAGSIVVTSTADQGSGTLRDALASAEGASIVFDPAVFPAASPAVIRPATALPCVNREITLDASNAGVILDGSALPEGSLTNGVSFCGSALRSVVMGLQVINFPGSGFVVSGSQNTVGGDRGRGTGPIGQGNLSSGNHDAGVSMGSDARGNSVKGNLLGVAPTNHPLKYQQTWGVFLAGAEGNVIGGSTAADRNIVSGNQIEVNVAHSARDNTVAGNYIGTDVSGRRVAPTQHATSSEVGVAFEGYAHDNLVADNIIASGQAVNLADTGSSYNRIIRNRIGVGPDDQPIEGLTASLGNGISLQQAYNLVADNVIGGLRAAAIDIFGAADVFIVGNRIGTDSSGTRAIPNAPGFASVVLRGGRRTFVGGSSATERNIISGNDGPAIEMLTGSNHNFILGNAIGASAYGLPLGNSGAGVLALGTGSVIQRNSVTANRGSGIDLRGAPKNIARRNAIWLNEGPGIATPSVSDSPPPPTITHVTLSRIEGMTCGGCVVEVFSDDSDEGRVYEGSSVASATGAFNAEAIRGIFIGPAVTATATTAAGATSMFSTPVTTPPRPPKRRSVRH